jgi:hypothetical protein
MIPLQMINDKLKRAYRKVLDWVDQILNCNYSAVDLSIH